MKIVPVTEELCDRVWSRVGGSSGMWSLIEGRSEESLLGALLRSYVVCESEYGLLRIDNVTPHHSAVLHGLVWDHRFFKNMAYNRMCVRNAASIAGVQQLVSVVPDGVRSLRRLMVHLGFKPTVRIPNYYKVPGRCIDGMMYVRIFEED